MHITKWITGFSFIQMVETKGVLAFLPLCARSQGWRNGTVGGKKRESTHGQIKKGWREEGKWEAEKEKRRRRKEMIYSKSSAGTGLPLLRVSPTSLSLSLCSIYNSMGNCWVGSSEGFCCNWFKMQVVSLVVRKRRKGSPVSYMDSMCMLVDMLVGPCLLNCMHVWPDVTSL